jgi:DNA-binding IscR family transcriptional regulator
VLCDIARRHLSGEPPASEGEVSDRLGVPSAQIERVVDKGVRRGLLLRSAVPPGIGLARAPENISAAEILETVRGELIVPTSARDAAAEVLRRRDAALGEGLSGITLKSLIHETLDELPRTEETAGEIRRDH